MQNILKSEKFLIIAILAVGLLSFGFLVYSDTATTSVTVGNATPSISSLSFNGGNDLTLSENTFVRASTTMTVTDTNGCSDITSVVATLYLAPTSGNSGTLCTYDGEDCYTQSTGSCTATTTGNQCDGGSDTSVQYDCGFQVWYTAHPTDASAPTFSTSIWTVSATTTDGTDTSTATNTAETIEFVTLNALSVTGTISYPATAAGANTGATTQTITITDTGNTAGDTEISGDTMCDDYPTCDTAGGSDAFAQDQQKFGLSDVTYGSLTYNLAATGSPATIETVLAKPTATTSAITDLTYWGIAIPSGQAADSYTGLNTFTAVSD